jgi:hypothetical protein
MLYIETFEGRGSLFICRNLSDDKNSVYIIKREDGEILLQPPLLYKVTILNFHWNIPGRNKEDDPIVRRPAYTFEIIFRRERLMH